MKRGRRKRFPLEGLKEGETCRLELDICFSSMTLDGCLVVGGKGKGRKHHTI